MKKLYLILMVLVASLSVSAQSIKLYKNGFVEREMDISAVDSIVYCPGEDESLPILGYYGYMDWETYHSTTLTVKEKLNIMIENAKTNTIRHSVTEVKGPTKLYSIPVMLTKEKHSPFIRLHDMTGWYGSVGMRNPVLDGVEATTTIDNENYYVWYESIVIERSDIRLEITLDADFGLYSFKAQSEEAIASLTAEDFQPLYSTSSRVEYPANSYIVVLTPQYGGTIRSYRPWAQNTSYDSQDLSEGTEAMGKTKVINGKTYYQWYAKPVTIDGIEYITIQANFESI